MSSLEEPNASATRLEWSADDNDDFFSEDEKEGSDGDGDWGDDGFDVDDGVDVSPEDVKEVAVDDSDAPNPVVPGLLEDDDPSPSDPGLLEDTAMDATNADAVDATDNADPSLTADPAPTRSAQSSNSSRPPPSGSRITRQHFKQERLTSSKAMADTPNILSSGSMDSGTGSAPANPLSLAGTTTASPLVELEDEDQNFEEIVRKRNRDRKEREDYHIAHIKVQMGRLEDALAAETKRRVDATTALDELARSQVHEMEERVRAQLREENEQLQIRLSALEERVQTLEQGWIADSNHQIELVNGKATDLRKLVAQIRDDQNMERKARLKREGILLQQVEEHASETEDRWTSEHNDRVRCLNEVEDQVIRNEARLALEHKRYEDRIEEELASLKDEMVIESMERQAQDEDIVAALNRYTQQLQHSLSILSSD